jgi:hypothetical protein
VRSRNCRRAVVSLKWRTERATRCGVVLCCAEEESYSAFCTQEIAAVVVVAAAHLNIPVPPPPTLVNWILIERKAKGTRTAARGDKLQGARISLPLCCAERGAEALLLGVLFCVLIVFPLR